MRLLARARQGSAWGPARWGYAWRGLVVTAAVAACGPKGAPDAASPAAPTTESVVKPAPSKRLTFYEALAAAKDGDLLPEPDETVVNLFDEARDLEAKTLEALGWTWKQRPSFEWYAPEAAGKRRTSDTTFPFHVAAVGPVGAHLGLPETETTTASLVHRLGEGYFAAYDGSTHRIVGDRAPRTRERNALEVRASFVEAVVEAALVDAFGRPDDKGIFAVGLRASDARATARALLRLPARPLHLRADESDRYGRNTGRGGYARHVSLQQAAIRDGAGCGLEAPLLAAIERGESSALRRERHIHPPATFVGYLGANGEDPPFVPISVKVGKSDLPPEGITDPSFQFFLDFLANTTSENTVASVRQVRGGISARTAGGMVRIYSFESDSRTSTYIHEHLSEIALFRDIPGGFLLATEGRGNKWLPSDLARRALADASTMLERSRDTTRTEKPTPLVTKEAPLWRSATCDGDAFLVPGARVALSGYRCDDKKNPLRVSLLDAPFSSLQSIAGDWAEDMEDQGASAAVYTKKKTPIGDGFLAENKQSIGKIIHIFIPLCDGIKSLNISGFVGEGAPDISFTTESAQDTKSCLGDAR